MPGGVAKPVPGGFELSGRWSYSSGSDHCPWTFLGGVVEGDATDFRSFLLPRKDCKFIDTWHTHGLAATGSHDIVVEKAFVPEHRTHKFIDGFKGENPGRSVNDGLIFRMPFMQVFLRCITSGQIGALQALLDQFLQYASTKMSEGKPLAQHPDAPLLVAETRAAIWEMKSTMRSVFATLKSYAARGAFPTMEERLLFRHFSAEVADRCVRMADGLTQLTGGGLVYDKFGLNRILRNMQTGRQHACGLYRPYARKLGTQMLGQPVEEVLL
jgi:3-hydroxy-9,10-secoandrosta-1,3,5(10)-triene-9,17-dione monooxygenase